MLHGHLSTGLLRMSDNGDWVLPIARLSASLLAVSRWVGETRQIMSRHWLYKVSCAAKGCWLYECGFSQSSLVAKQALYSQYSDLNRIHHLEPGVLYAHVVQLASTRGLIELWIGIGMMTLVARHCPQGTKRNLRSGC